MAADRDGKVERALLGAGRLALLTCGGAFDERTRHYADNIVVVGLPEA